MNRRSFIKKSAEITALASGISIGSLRANVREKISTHQSADTHYNVIVIGVGSMGAASCYYLAKRGVKVLGIEQFSIPNELASHGGQSRVIRKAYFEHPSYVPLLEKAYKNWEDLEREIGLQIYYKTGLLYFGEKDHILMKGVLRSANEYNLEVNELSIDEQKKQFSQFSLPNHYQRLIEPDAGFVTPERAILAYTEGAIKHGAVVKVNEKTISWNEKQDEVQVVTDKGNYTCEKLIITAGAWTGKILPSYAKHLKVTRQMLAWVIPKKWDLFDLDTFPCWTIADHEGEGIYYGFPIVPTGHFGGPIGLKLAHHFHGEISDPDELKRQPTKEDEENLINMMKKFMPQAYESTHTIKACMYTNTADENFVIDLLPNYNRVSIAAGFSGHGYKFASVIGEIMADLVMEGKTEMPIEFLNAKRLL